MIPLGQSQQPSKPDLGPLRGRTILVVDDEVDIRDLVAMMLKNRGVNSITTDSADGALEILQRHSDDIALVLLDLKIPNSSDVPAIDLIRDEYPQIPVIIMTGMAHGDAQADRPGDPLVGYLRKPFRPAALYDALSQRGRMSDPTRRRTRRDGEGRPSDEMRFRKT